MLAQHQKLHLFKESPPPVEEEGLVVVDHVCFEKMGLPKGGGRKWECGKSHKGRNVYECVLCGNDSIFSLYTYV